MFHIMHSMKKALIGNRETVAPGISANKIAATMATIRSCFQHNKHYDAKDDCRSILLLDPANAEAWYYLGRVAYDQGGFAESMECFRKAMEYSPDWADACNHYGNALRQLGRLDEALERYQQAKGLKPDYADPVGNIGFVFMAQGQSEEAEQCFREALEIDPNLVAAWNGLALLFHSQGKSHEAVEFFKEALRRSPENLATLNNLGVVLLALKQANEAVEIFRRAVTVSPDNSKAFNSLGIALREIGQIEEAIISYRQAIELNPAYPDAYNNLGVALYETGRLQDAEVNCRHALTLRPSYPEALNNLALVCKASGRLVEAEDCCRRSLELLPANTESLNDLGIILREDSRNEEAKKAFEAAVAQQPARAVPWYNLGLIRIDQGDLEGSIDCYHQALKYQSDYTDALNNLGASYTKQGRIEDALTTYLKAVAADQRFSALHSSLLLTMQYSPRYSEKDIYLESRRWGGIYGNHAAIDFSNEADPQRKLRIGYVSPDFRRHSVSYFLRSHFTHHSRAEVMIFCYSDVATPDECTDFFRSSAAGWHNTYGLGDEEVARMVTEDKIDILVDLAAHTGKRLTLFTRKLAPVQVTWLGYPGTTGLSTIDYRISDDIADPIGQSDRYHSEKVCRLPDGFLCYTPPIDAPVVAPLPAVAKQITFGSFNSIAKITAEVVGVWSDLLLRIPEARLIIKTYSMSDTTTRKRYAELFAVNGISAERVDLRPWEPSTASHLAVYGEVDIALDSFPYNGTTTTCESLWMGVPVITLAGDRHSGRVGASILSRVNLGDLVAASPDEYIQIAETLAQDKKRLAAIRRTLRGEMQLSSLCDGNNFARNIEGAFRSMWCDWCSSRFQ